MKKHDLLREEGNIGVTNIKSKLETKRDVIYQKRQVGATISSVKIAKLLDVREPRKYPTSLSNFGNPDTDRTTPRSYAMFPPSIVENTFGPDSPNSFPFKWQESKSTEQEIRRYSDSSQKNLSLMTIKKEVFVNKPSHRKDKKIGTGSVTTSGVKKSFTQFEPWNNPYRTRKTQPVSDERSFHGLSEGPKDQRNKNHADGLLLREMPVPFGLSHNHEWKRTEKTSGPNISTTRGPIPADFHIPAQQKEILYTIDTDTNSKQVLMRRKRFPRIPRRPARAIRMALQERRAIGERRRVSGALPPSSDQRVYGRNLTVTATPKPRDHPPEVPSKKHGRPPERGFAAFTALGGTRGGVDFPLPFTESVRVDGCRCVEYNGPSGSSGSTKTTPVASNDLGGEPRAALECHCVGAAVEDVPRDLGSDVAKLIFERAGVKALQKDCLQFYAHRLLALHLNSVRFLSTIEPGIFDSSLQLREIFIQKAPRLHSIGEGVLKGLPNLKVLRITHSGLKSVPPMHQLQPKTHVEMIDLDSNQISVIPSGGIKVKAGAVILNYNVIKVVHSHAFNGSAIAELRLRGNRGLKTIEDAAFVGLSNLIRIDLSETAVERLPTLGLEGLEVLEVRGTPSLQSFPSVYHFRYIREAHLTYPYHCCAFEFPETHNPEEHRRFQKDCAHHASPQQHDSLVLARNTATASDATGSAVGQAVWSYLEAQLFITRRWLFPIRERPAPFDQVKKEVDVPAPGHIARGASVRPFGSVMATKLTKNDARNSTSPAPPFDGFFHGEVRPQRNMTLQVVCGALASHHVLCTPAPDAFNPCEDVMGRAWLRCAIWIVLVAALVGNSAVMLVLLSSRLGLSVSKFLMCNLAFADLCMGAYLFLLAVVDAHTAGAYFNHAIPWQHGAGCQVAGFLTVFASELSIFTLTVITLERWYAITYAIHLNRRLRLRTAARVMAAGWVLSVLAAVLPILGVSSYTRTSICLPMETRAPADLAYLAGLLSSNGIAFLLICACYARMYASIAGRHASTAGDTTVAKRMALLVFTDFACWAPIAFFGLTAVAGYPLIDVTHSKILLVFFYPLNSCANPFLYAILTKQYRRDLFVLLSRYGFCTRRALRYKDASSVTQNAKKRLTILRIEGNPQQNGSADAACEDAPVDTQEESHCSVAASNRAGSPHPLRNISTKLGSLGHCATISVSE
ncbi:follicle-stimulating hormone receptor-like [Haemaphysalis longicornis]